MTKHVVFDLDDTLYKERDYVYSALRFAGSWLTNNYQINEASETLLKFFESGEKDPIGKFCHLKGLKTEEVSGLISQVRSHAPLISLDTGASDVIKWLHKAGYSYSILTDGRSITQRRKIEALGLTQVRLVIISEEIGSEKPNLKGFEVIQDTIAASEYLYIGDNPKKDFIAPKALGWTTVMLKANEKNIHKQVLEPELSKHPDHIIRTFWQLRRLIEC